MPFVANMDDEEKQDQQNPSQGPVSPVGGGGGAVRLAPSSSVAPAGGSGASGTSSTAPKAAGGSFASLNQYVDANQGQAQPLANTLSTSIGKNYSDLDAQNNAAIANINSQVASAPGYTPSNPDVMSKEAANPVSFAGDAGNVKQFQSLLNNSYGGPASAEGTTDFSNQQAAINNAIATGAQQTTTEAGREGLLSQNEATPTSGVTALNSAILSQSPEALGQVESAYKPFSNLLTNLNTGAQGVDTTISKEQADAASSAKAANDAISSQINALNTGVGSELTTAQNNAVTQANTLKADLAAGTISPTDLQALGMTADQWNSLSAADKAAATSQMVTSANGQFGANSGTANIDLTNFLTSQDPNLAYNTANVATAGDYAKAQAFQTLLNGLNLNTPTMAINPTTASQAGTAPTNLNNFDYGTALSTAQSTKADEIAGAQAYADALAAGADDAHAQLAAQTAAKNSMIAKAGAAANTIVGSSEAVGAGVPSAAKNYAQNVVSSNPTKIAENVGSMGLIPAGEAVAAGATQAVKTISQIFCFHPDTLVEMADGSCEQIHKIKVGDDTRGGKVLATTRGIGQGFYWYEGVLVTAKHAVKEDGVWVRVEDSKNGRPFKYLTEVVCNLVTDKHRIWAHGVEFADEHENDNYENLNLRQSLDALNGL